MGYNNLLFPCAPGLSNTPECAQAISNVSFGMRDLIRIGKRPEYGVRYIFVSTLTPPGQFLGGPSDRRIANDAIVQRYRHHQYGSCRGRNAGRHLSHIHRTRGGMSTRTDCICVRLATRRLRGRSSASSRRRDDDAGRALARGRIQGTEHAEDWREDRVSHGSGQHQARRLPTRARRSRRRDRRRRRGLESLKQEQPQIETERSMCSAPPSATPSARGPTSTSSSTLPASCTTARSSSARRGGRARSISTSVRYRTIRSVLPRMIERGNGTIVNVSSSASSIKGIPCTVSTVPRRLR